MTHDLTLVGPPQKAPTLLPAAVEMLQELRRELAITLAGVAGIPAARPVRTIRREQDQSETRIWHDGDTLCVLTCHSPRESPSLHIASQAGRNGWPRLQALPDWTAIGADEAFAVAGALLGAALAVTTAERTAG